MRTVSRATEKSSAAARKTRMVGPMALWVKECTELKTPERVMNVPRMVSRYVAIIKITVQPLRTPLRSTSSAEWTAAVAVSQGRNEAFSTGSHAQYPPQPSTSYAHQPPSTIATVRKIQGSKRKLRSGRMKSCPSRPTRSAAQPRPNGIVIPT